MIAKADHGRIVIDSLAAAPRTLSVARKIGVVALERRGIAGLLPALRPRLRFNRLGPLLLALGSLLALSACWALRAFGACSPLGAVRCCGLFWAFGPLWARSASGRRTAAATRRGA